MPQLLTMKGYADGQGRIARDVEREDRLFDELVHEIIEDRFQYKKAGKIEKRFGSPIFKRPAMYQGRELEEWLYRYAKDFEGNKVYMYFDEQGKLVDFEYVNSKQFTEK